MTGGKKVKEKVSTVLEELISVRRHLHRYPELSFREEKTAAYIEAKLAAWNIPSGRVAETGVLATIEGRFPEGKTIVLRGDTDALPIQENTGLSFSSVHNGIMHACGHDVHTACVLGAARVLNEMKHDFAGTIKILFQPGEEKLPGGASLVLSSGVLDRPKPAAVLGQHVYPELEAGKIGIRPGIYMASADEIYISVKGPGGHAALPDKTIDVIYTAAGLIQQIQQVVSRNAPPLTPSVLTFGHIEGLGATNVIPKEVRMEGTFRTFDESWRSKAHQRIEEITQGVARACGATIDVEIRKGYPHLYNHPELTERVRQYAVEFLGTDNVVDLEMRMTSEDFAYYSHSYDSCFWRLGVCEKGGPVRNLHTPEFRVDESAIETGTGFMAYAALRQLE